MTEESRPAVTFARYLGSGDRGQGNACGSALGETVGVRIRRSPRVEQSEDRHSPDWYDQSDELVALEPGDRLFIACDGGPCTSRLEVFPPRLEIRERDGMYVLDDNGPRDGWRYVFVSRDA
jgi:hypothetical protein